MCEFKYATCTVVIAWFLQEGLFLESCSNTFNFQRSGAGKISRKLVFKNDFSGTYTLELKVAATVHSNESITVARSTSNEDIQNGKSIVYKVQLPTNQRSQGIISTLIGVTFNGKLYCDDVVPDGTQNVQNILHRSFSSKHEESWQTQAVHGEFLLPVPPSQESSRSQRVKRKASWQPPPMPTADTSECGIKREYLPLVLDSQPTKEGEHPWLVALFYSKVRIYTYRCAGTLISNRHVITAAHCVDGKLDKTKLFAVFGSLNIENWIAKTIYRNAENIIVHPDYFHISYADVAVIIIDAPVPFSDLIRPICLWDESTDLSNIVGLKGIVAGWGEDKPGNNYVRQARQIDIPIVGEVTCLRSNLQFFRLTSKGTFCAGAGDGRIPCRGDSGSGFVMKRGGRWMLRGVVSSALSDSQVASCDGSHYAVFSDVPQYNAWLTPILKEGYKPPTETTSIRSPAKDGMKVICHYKNTVGSGEDSTKFLPEDFDGDVCTHITFGFAPLDPNSLTLSQNTLLDKDNKYYKKVISYQPKGVKVLVTLGSWEDSKGNKYSRLLTDASARSRFIVHVTQFIEEWGFDGLDLGFGYPKCWTYDCDKLTIKPALAQFLKELHEVFAPRGWLLSAVVANHHKVINDYYDVPAFSKYPDWISVICYDYPEYLRHGTAHSAPLYEYPGYHSHLNTNNTINYLIELGADPKKLVIRMPSYGRSYTLTDPNEHDLHANFDGLGLAGEFTKQNGLLAFYEICAKVKQQIWNVVRDPKGRIGPYAYKGNQWVSYDDIAEIKRKSQYVKANGLGGGSIWILDFDDFNNTCGCGHYPLLRMMNYELRGVPLENNLENCT